MSPEALLRAKGDDAELLFFRMSVMHYVYLLRSISVPEQRYIGCTSDLKARLAAHNRGESRHTAKYLPWQIETYLAFQSVTSAQSFEKYLKTGSGQAFANKRFWSKDLS
jgi:putative endonuclease